MSDETRRRHAVKGRGNVRVPRFIAHAHGLVAAPIQPPPNPVPTPTPTPAPTGRPWSKAFSGSFG
jgi:hypothetical protein